MGRLQNLLNDLTTFIGDNTQFDDITMLCLEYRGYEKDKLNKISLHTEVDNVSKGIAPIVSLLNELGVDSGVVYKIELAIDELLTNVFSYAYAPGTGKIEIEYEILESPRTLSVTIIDEGKEFNPLDSDDPDISLPSEERQIGGLGLFIVKKTMDEIKYDRKNNKNILTIKKRIWKGLEHEYQTK